jgi:thymidylate synthase
MRIYKNCKEAIKDIGRELKKCSSTVHTDTYQDKDISENPDFDTKEIEAYQFSILDITDRQDMPNITPVWLKAEFKERVSGFPLNPGSAWKERQEVWEQFLEKSGGFSYTYPERMWYQLNHNIKELREHPTTRQAIIQIHNRQEDQENMSSRRIPCSMFYQFLIRNGKLDIIYVMRSSDFATHFQNDIHLAMDLQQWMADKVKVPAGKFIMFVSSLHIYKKDWDLLSNY